MEFFAARIGQDRQQDPGRRNAPRDLPAYAPVSSAYHRREAAIDRWADIFIEVKANT